MANQLRAHGHLLGTGVQIANLLLDEVEPVLDELDARLFLVGEGPHREPLERLYLDRKLRQEMSLFARRHALRFRWESVLDDLLGEVPREMPIESDDDDLVARDLFGETAGEPVVVGT